MAAGAVGAVSFEDVVAGEAATLFRKQEWFELALYDDLNDAPYLDDLSKADTDEDRIAALGGRKAKESQGDGARKANKSQGDPGRKVKESQAMPMKAKIPVSPRQRRVR